MLVTGSLEQRNNLNFHFLEIMAKFKNSKGNFQGIRVQRGPCPT